MDALRAGWDRVWNAVVPGGAGDDVFCRERGRVLGYFLARPRVYYSQFFRERLE